MKHEALNFFCTQRSYNKKMEVAAVNGEPSTNIPGNEDGQLVAVSFKKNPHYAQKYLEAEPKALGLTQVTLSVFQISMLLALSMPVARFPIFVDVSRIIGSLFVIIAGITALAAQTLHLPTLKACFAMQVVAILASVINVIISCGTVEDYDRCWMYEHNETESLESSCRKMKNATSHFHAEVLLINIAILAICVTLAAYSGKTLNCCGARTSTPVITISAPPAQQ
ncbi:hypothetical protein GJAV_G00266060 [Gymnothorax javanicus]|nr:hypothetical protein GJAV_G00266060 [Gymnothorax javanicus]